MAQLLCIHKADNGSGPVRKPQLVFIHGLGGDIKSTWMHDPEVPESLWPGWVGVDAGLTTWVLGYDAALSAWRDSAMPLPDQGSTVLDALVSESELGQADLVLVGHSLGGLVIKTALVNAMTQGVPRYEALAKRVRGVVFVATPHAGSELAKLAKSISVLLRTNEQVGNMASHDAHLRNLSDQFRHQHKKLGFGVRTFAEMRGVFVGKKFLGLRLGSELTVVDPSSSNPHVADEVPVRLPQDHFSICKPQDRKEQIHKSLLEFLRTLTSPPDPPPTPPPTPQTVASGPPTAPDWERLSKPAQRGRLQGQQDNRLQPREGKLIGRVKEVEAVLHFLNGQEDGAVVCAQITGTGGIGKTEVCKAALKQWLAQHPDAVAFYIDVPDTATADELVALLGQALGADNLTSLGELTPLLQPGLYYLDNLEGVAERPEGQQLLRQLRQLPGVRVLASSRISLPGILGAPIDVGVLPLADAQALFRALWLGADALPPAATDGAVETLVQKELGCHALSISLLARLGNVYSFSQLQQRWHASGTATAFDAGDASRLGSLARSLQLTADALNQHAGALDLWVLAALFPQGIDEDLFSLLEQWGGWAEHAARQQLARHHVLSLRQGRLHLLPPLARYALQQALAAAEGFSWAQTRLLAFRLFQQLADAADSIASSKESLAGREVLLQQFDALVRLLEIDAGSAQPDVVALRRLNQALLNQYKFRPYLSRQALQAVLSHLNEPAHTLRVLGDLEGRLGQVDKARTLYDKALALYKTEQDGLGQANTLKALGDLERRLGQVDKARALYDQALALFKTEQDGLGQANTLKALGDLESRLGQVDKARALYDQALALYKTEQDGLGQANTLQALGDLEKRLGHVDGARTLYDQALALFRTEHDGLGQANTLQALGDLESRLGQVDRARTLYDQALALFKIEQAGLGQANTLKALGDQEGRLGQVDKARTLYDQALALFKIEQAGLGQANTLKAVGDLERRLGQVDKARTLYDQALALFKSEQDGLGRANTLKALGDLERRLGQVDKARTLYDQALALYKTEQDGLGQANTLQALGDLESRLGHVDGARTLYDQALALYKNEQAGLGQANTLHSLGELESRQGHVDEARALYEQALALYKNEQDGLGQANTLLAMGDMERRLGQVDKALARFQGALALYTGEHETMGLAYTCAELARCHHAGGNMERRDDSILQALDWAAKSNTESVVRYVTAVLVEIQGDPQAAAAWLEQQENG